MGNLTVFLNTSSRKTLFYLEIPPKKISLFYPCLWNLSRGISIHRKAGIKRMKVTHLHVKLYVDQIILTFWFVTLKFNNFRREMIGSHLIRANSHMGCPFPNAIQRSKLMPYKETFRATNIQTHTRAWIDEEERLKPATPGIWLLCTFLLQRLSDRNISSFSSSSSSSPLSSNHPRRLIIYFASNPLHLLPPLL